MYYTNFEEYERLALQSEHERKDYRCHECNDWFEETTTFFDMEENKEIELCEDCIVYYK